MTAAHTESTIAYWQQVLRPDEVPHAASPWRLGYPARLPDGRVLMLPIRALGVDPQRAVASLLINQASFDPRRRLVLGIDIAGRISSLHTPGFIRP